ncbi:MAG TPA: hypothetical protein VHB98_20825, partial [Chloroflexota bacterium]|nr:hypothetical protein [Chloroflexota bacterium]
AWLLSMGDDTALDQLLAAYPDEAGAHWAYTQALHAFRRHGAGALADQAVRRAFQANPHVPHYLLGAKPLPKHVPGYYGMGDEHEAVVYLVEAAEVWLETPGAPEWLADVLARARPASVAPKTRRPRRR